MVVLDSPVRSTHFYSGQAKFQSSTREQLRQGGVVGVERSHDQTKMVESLNGRKLPQILALKQQTQNYKDTASKTISWV